MIAEKHQSNSTAKQHSSSWKYQWLVNILNLWTVGEGNFSLSKGLKWIFLTFDHRTKLVLPLCNYCAQRLMLSLISNHIHKNTSEQLITVIKMHAKTDFPVSACRHEGSALSSTLTPTPLLFESNGSPYRWKLYQWI